MEVEFAKDKLKRLYVDKDFTGGFGRDVIKAFRKVVQQIRAATDERDLYARPGLRFEKLSGQRQHQRSMRLNDQYRLIVELSDSEPQKVLRVLDIEDYH